MEMRKQPLQAAAHRTGTRRDKKDKKKEKKTQSGFLPLQMAEL